jgi:hypothetical protein
MASVTLSTTVQNIIWNPSMALEDRPSFGFGLDLPGEPVDYRIDAHKGHMEWPATLDDELVFKPDSSGNFRREAWDYPVEIIYPFFGYE